MQKYISECLHYPWISNINVIRHRRYLYLTAPLPENQKFLLVTAVQILIDTTTKILIDNPLIDNTPSITDDVFTCSFCQGLSPN